MPSRNVLFKTSYETTGSSVLRYICFLLKKKKPFINKVFGPYDVSCETKTQFDCLYKYE